MNHSLISSRYLTGLTCQVCKALREIVDGNVHLQLCIELYIDQMSLDELHRPARPSPLDAIQALRQNRTAWASLSPHSMNNLNVSPYPTYEVVGRMFARGVSRPGTSNLTSGIELWQLPERGDIAREKCDVCIREDFGLDAIDFTFDPAQDLLVLAELTQYASSLCILRICIQLTLCIGRENCSSISSVYRILVNITRVLLLSRPNSSTST